MSRIQARPDSNLRALGAYYGYPACCVDSFIGAINAGKLPREVTGPGPWEGTGFIPCPDCGADIHAHGLASFVETRIMPNRRAPLPFGPNATPTDAELSRVLEGAA